jgi:hypothetical protein
MHPDPQATLVAVVIGVVVLMAIFAPLGLVMLIGHFWRARRRARRRNRLHRTGGYIR